MTTADKIKLKLNSFKEAFFYTIQNTFPPVFFYVMIPLTYFFEVVFVFPEFYAPWTFWYNWHLFWGTTLLLNLFTCIVAMLKTNTSIKGVQIPIEKDSDFCSVCETVIPPRAFHCNICDICILKRDHHCMFTNCCVGLNNQRYFMMVLFYTFLGTVYASYFNMFYFNNKLDITSFFFLARLFFPMVVMIYDLSLNQLYIFLFATNLFAMIFIVVAFGYNVFLVYKGLTSNEYTKRNFIYDLGVVENIKLVFGKNWKIAWISPFIKSELPHNGVRYQLKQHSC